MATAEQVRDFPYGDYELASDDYISPIFDCYIDGSKKLYFVKSWKGEDVIVVPFGVGRPVSVNGSFVRLFVLPSGEGFDY